MSYFFLNKIESNNSNWVIFFRGLETTNQIHRFFVINLPYRSPPFWVFSIEKPWMSATFEKKYEIRSPPFIYYVFFYWSLTLIMNPLINCFLTLIMNINHKQLIMFNINHETYVPNNWCFAEINESTSWMESPATPQRETWCGWKQQYWWAFPEDEGVWWSMYI